MPQKQTGKGTKGSTEEPLNEGKEEKVNKSLEQNINKIKEIFRDDDTLVYRYFENHHDRRIRCCIIYTYGMTDNEMVYRSIIGPVVGNGSLEYGRNIVDDLCSSVIESDNVERIEDFNDIIAAIIDGSTILLTENQCEALIINTISFETRGIEEPESEKAVRGPREGFTESLTTNLTMIRRKIKTPDLKFCLKTLGVRTRTSICICYIDGIANEKVLQELLKRLDDINIDGILSAGYIQEMISDHPFSLFDTIGYTERPDVIASKLLEGRISIFVDGTPMCLTVPQIFIELFQSNEDYYENFYFSSVTRFLRIVGFVLTIITPALYIALTCFHQEMMPTPLFMSIQIARSGIPMPIVAEALSMIIVFEILKEAGSRMPSYIGQALSIVGALVIGEAAVDARLISAPMIIVIAFSGITSLMINRLKTPALWLRVIFLLFASFMGFYGLIFGITGMLISLYGMRSFGIPYMTDISIISSDFQDLKDTYIRAPWWYMKNRPKFIAAKNIIRKSSGSR